jgi:Cu/Ag efflux protein CusF
MMKSLSKWVSALTAIVLLAGSAVAGDAVASGKIKAINSTKKEFVVTDAAGKNHTFKLDTKVVINRGGKESQSDLNAGDMVNVLYDKGLLTWTAEYILVQEGDTKTCALMCGTIKSYDVEKKQVAFTDEHAKDFTFDLGETKVRLNKENSTVEKLKIGDHALAIVDKVADKVTLKALMVHRK